MTLKKLAVSAWSLACRQLEKREHGLWRQVIGGLDVHSLQVALVKQSTYCDLYSVPFSGSPAGLLATSWHRTGPIGLFLGCKTQFVIVKPDPAPECRVWEEKLVYEVGSGDERGERFPLIRQKQLTVAVAAESVDWSQFDIVVAIENAVPAAVTGRYPSVVWCTMLEHHRMRPYWAYLKKPPIGYDLFLNLRMGPNPVSLFKKPHVIDFPYGLNQVSGLARIYQRDAASARVVMLEDNQDASLLGPMLEDRGLAWRQGGVPGGSLADYHRKLAGCRFLLAPRSRRPLGGLAAMDAAAMDCLVIGRGADCWNPYLILPELDIGDPVRAVERVAALAKDDVEFDRLLEKQRARLAWFGWNRPWAQLLAARERLKRDTETGN
jgi:hypothetical protein